jgi:hypothetical protein
MRNQILIIALFLYSGKLLSQTGYPQLILGGTAVSSSAVSSDYGNRLGLFHNAIDISATNGTTIRAIAGTTGANDVITQIDRTSEKIIFLAIKGTAIVTGTSISDRIGSGIDNSLNVNKVS